MSGDFSVFLGYISTEAVDKVPCSSTRYNSLGESGTSESSITEVFHSTTESLHSTNHFVFCFFLVNITYYIFQAFP